MVARISQIQQGFQNIHGMQEVIGSTPLSSTSLTMKTLRPNCRRVFCCAAVGQASPAPGDCQASPASWVLLRGSCFGVPALVSLLLASRARKCPGVMPCVSLLPLTESRRHRAVDSCPVFGVASRGRESAGVSGGAAAFSYDELTRMWAGLMFVRRAGARARRLAHGSSLCLPSRRRVFA